MLRGKSIKHISGVTSGCTSPLVALSKHNSGGNLDLAIQTPKSVMCYGDDSASSRLLHVMYSTTESRHLLLRKRAHNSNLDFTVADILMLPII